MNVDHDLHYLIPRYALMQSVELAPSWTSVFIENEISAGPDALIEIATLAGWAAPKRQTRIPKPHELPMLAYAPHLGWLVIEQWETSDRFRVVHRGGAESALASDIEVYFTPQFPDPTRSALGNRAADVFIQAIKARRNVFVSAIIATVAANIIALVTSLYSMQVYDRVIPRAGYSTLIVLTAGAIFALVLDFALRSTRALMIERESAHIDEEISEFFFSRAQSIRLDARPQSVGTMAGQLRGIEQVRSLMSSTTMFLVADLPFALFFIFVISMLGGIVALVPLISFPISIGLAFLFARMIRGDTNKAQLSSNRKNGLLVESLDAAETVKANSGSWFLLAKWNHLLAELHRYEDPIKRNSAMAGSIFSSIQQVSYIGLIAFGAVEVSSGHMTSGALIACGIIAGRVNGPLIAMLPSMIVQWGYAKSSLKALDGILALPTDDSARAVNLRPEKLTGEIVVEAVRFAYPQARPSIEIERLSFKPGERVAIIGGIGSGKSTLLRLLAGLYKPGEGRVLINNLEMSHIAPDIVRKHFGYIPQDSRLVNGTLKENILMGLADPGDDAVARVTEQTGLSRLIVSHPMGVSLPISEGGRGLSGGQRMLSALTRLLLAKPKVLLLDEPTANLDQTTEQQVLEAIMGSLRDDDIMVLVTHKLALLSLVQRVVVLAQGKVVLDGTTQDVLNQMRARPTGLPPAKAVAS